MNLILLVLAGIFVNNYVMSQFLGICPFLGVSKKVDTAAGMGHGCNLRNGSGSSSSMVGIQPDSGTSAHYIPV